MNNYWIDLRSDTVTKPTEAMKEAMFNAQVGDDVFMEDPTVNELQEYAAALFGFEDALFCASGTQSNQIGIKLHTQPGDEVICHRLSHVYLYEGGGIAFNSGASVRLLNGDRGIFTASEVEQEINRDDVHFPASKLVCIENTVNKGGGACWDFNEILKIKELCTKHGMALHLDGARLFNALTAKSETPEMYGKAFDTISICLSKGLGAPAGSLLLGNRMQIKKARRIRKVMGGGMRQAGYLAAAGLYGLKENTQRLQIDHFHATEVGKAIENQPWVESILPVETNIVIFKIIDSITSSDFINRLSEKGIRAVEMGKNSVRFVFHLNQTDNDISKLIEMLSNLY